MSLNDLDVYKNASRETLVDILNELMPGAIGAGNPGMLNRARVIAAILGEKEAGIL
jgi:hypothetical protein